MKNVENDGKTENIIVDDNLPYLDVISQRNIKFIILGKILFWNSSSREGIHLTLFTIDKPHERQQIINISAEHTAPTSCFYNLTIVKV